MITIDKIEKEVKRIAPKRSAWQKGILQYVNDLLQQLRETEEDSVIYESDLTDINLLDRLLLGGARDWKQYSYGGFALETNRQIAKRMCSPSEWIQTKGGTEAPSMYEGWFDIQARALYQAAALIHAAVHFIAMREGN